MILRADAFSSQFDSQFDPYITYCMEEANCLKYFKEKMAESEDFKMYILVSGYAFFFGLAPHQTIFFSLLLRLYLGFSSYVHCSLLNSVKEFLKVILKADCSFD